jgi:hypothetical protein
MMQFAKRRGFDLLVSEKEEKRKRGKEEKRKREFVKFYCS